MNETSTLIVTPSAPPAYSVYSNQPGYPGAYTTSTSVVVGYTPAYGYGNSGAILVSQPIGFVANVIFGEFPQVIQCPFCHAQVTTSVEYVNGSLAWLCCMGLAFFGCILGCCLIPFCTPGFQDAEHKCPNCANIVGKFRRLN